MLDEEDFGIVFEADDRRFPLIVSHIAILTNVARFGFKA
jgi:hypothetical protein